MVIWGSAKGGHVYGRGDEDTSYINIIMLVHVCNVYDT